MEDRENNPLERFVFEIKSLQDAVEGMSLQDVEKRFADFLLKIALADLKPNPQGNQSKTLPIKGLFVRTNAFFQKIANSLL